MSLQALACLHPGCSDVFKALALEYEIVEEVAMGSVSYACRCDAVQVLHVLLGADVRVCHALSRNHEVARRLAHEHMLDVVRHLVSRCRGGGEKRKADASGVSLDFNGLLSVLVALVHGCIAIVPFLRNSYWVSLAVCAVLCC